MFQVTFMLIASIVRLEAYGLDLVYGHTHTTVYPRAHQALFSFTVPASASMSNEMILHAVMMASQLSSVTAAFVFHSGNVVANRIPRTCAS